MTTMPPDDDNPFAAPRSAIGPRAEEIDLETDEEAERIRLNHYRHESSIKSLGLLCYLGGLFCFFFAMMGALAATREVPANTVPPGSSPEMIRFFMWIGTAVFFMGGLTTFALGFGFRRLQVWSRWVGMVLSVPLILYLLAVGLFVMAIAGAGSSLPAVMILFVGVAVLAYVFYLLVIPRSGMVFSSEYRLIVQKTPNIVTRTSLILRIVLVMLAALLVLFMLAVLGSAFR